MANSSGDMVFGLIMGTMLGVLIGGLCAEGCTEARWRRDMMNGKAPQIIKMLETEESLKAQKRELGLERQ